MLHDVIEIWKGSTVPHQCRLVCAQSREPCVALHHVLIQTKAQPHSFSFYLLHIYKAAEMPGQSNHGPLEGSWMWLAEERENGKNVARWEHSVCQCVDAQSRPQIDKQTHGTFLFCDTQSQSEGSKERFHFFTWKIFTPWEAWRGNVSTQLNLVNTEKTESSTIGMRPCYRRDLLLW